MGAYQRLRRRNFMQLSGYTFIRSTLCFLLTFTLVAPAGLAQQPQAPAAPIATEPAIQPVIQPKFPSDQPVPFRIKVIEGDGAINNIRQPVNRGASVVVEDENHNPLSGVSVTFFLPNEGPSGLFPNGNRVLSVFTDDKGIASSRGVRFNNQVGLMKIGVVASLFAQTASATITQTNISSNSSIKSSYVPAMGIPKSSVRSHAKTWIILGVVAGAAAGGIYYFATRTSKPDATVSLGSGVPVVIAPSAITITR